jgi:hypothetical protein
MLFSEDRVHAVQVDSSGAPMLWINNNDWYTGLDGGHRELFSSILMDDLNEQDILSRYGAPESVDQCGASRIWRYADARRLTASLLRESPLQDKMNAPIDVSPYQPGEVLDFTLSRDNARPYLADGWSITEPWGTWSNGGEARINLPFVPGSGADLRLHVQAQGFLAGALTRQRIEVVVNGHSVAWWDFTAEDPSGERTAEIPVKVAGSRDPLRVVFRVPTAASPASLGITADARQLGVGVRRLWIDIGGSSGPPPG